MNMGNMDDMMGGMTWGAYLWMAMIGVLLLVAAIGVVHAALGHAKRGVSRPQAALPSSVGDIDEAAVILRRRYAQGEIGDDEFLNRHSMLKS